MLTTRSVVRLVIRAPLVIAVAALACATSCQQAPTTYERAMMGSVGPDRGGITLTITENGLLQVEGRPGTVVHLDE